MTRCRFFTYSYYEGQRYVLIFLTFKTGKINSQREAEFQTNSKTRVWIKKIQRIGIWNLEVTESKRVESKIPNIGQVSPTPTPCQEHGKNFWEQSRGLAAYVASILHFGCATTETMKKEKEDEWIGGEVPSLSPPPLSIFSARPSWPATKETRSGSCWAIACYACWGLEM